jgi:hypothetical protein
MTNSKDIIPSWMISPEYWWSIFGTFGFISFFIILFRLSIRTENTNTLAFAGWLQLQIIAFYVLLLSAYPVFMAIYKLFLIVIEWVVSLFSKRKTNRFMKWLGLIITDNVLYRMACLIGIAFYSYIIYYIVFLYGSLVYFGTILLLGYTKL